MLTQVGGLLNGRLRYTQPIEGFRSGIEPVFLAASVPARHGSRVLEAGTGAGAALLCLHARVPGLKSVGVELDSDMGTIAAANAAENGFGDMAIVSGNILSMELDGRFDHAIANPPYHGAGTVSPLATKERAKRGDVELVSAWIMRLGSLLRARGTLTLVVPSRAVPACIGAMAAARCACSVLFPLWPKVGADAKLVLVRGVREGRSPMRLAAGLILHEPNGTFTTAAQNVLRDAAALMIA